MPSKKTLSTISKIFQALIIAFIIGMASWMYYTIDELQDRVTIIETNRRENAAQWRLLKEQSAKIQETEIEMEVMKRVFQILLDQNKIKADRISLPRPKSLDKKRTVKEFRYEQMEKNEKR
jgi:Tfp pilus assembly protein PilO